jgi:hypothetical protein
MGRPILRLRISASRGPLITKVTHRRGRAHTHARAGMVTRSYEGWCQWSRAHQVLPGPL